MHPPPEFDVKDTSSAGQTSGSRADSTVSRGVLAAVALLILAIGTVAWLDLRRDANLLREDAARRLTSAEAAGAQSRAREAELAGDLREAQAKLALLEARLSESQSREEALEALYRELAPSRDDLALTEVEQILLIANQQLALAGNVPAALAALQLADGKLARIHRPPFSPLRRAIARDVDKLKSLPFIDVTAITLKLDQAIAQVGDLPLARDERVPAPKGTVPAENESAWRRALANVARELRSLVRLEVSERPAAPLVAPDQAYFLRENLRLRLLSARNAILGRQEATYKSDLKAASGWLRQYFDTRSKSVQQMSETLGQMLAMPLPDDLPDLAQSLDAVRTLKATQERQSPFPLTPARPNR
ncbi:MAG TPA: uroporphyrinogen-III C-methyltransferase [Casimicrobiaceae bacterium]|nr:uroporphyrinogen-III C-methyltransferase [Casimicrobiaceae bacterium]